jgi:hypothetical protein
MMDKFLERRSIVKKICVFAAILCLFVGNVSLSQSTKGKIFKKLMGEKLKSSQALIEGLALSDFNKLTENAQELIRISNTEEWVAIKSPKYELFTNDFRRHAEKLIAKAKAKNLDGAALAYFELTMTCIRCHDYVREVKEAKLNLPNHGTTTVHSGVVPSPSAP